MPFVINQRNTIDPGGLCTSTLGFLGNYAGFPSVIRCLNGDIIVIYERTVDHGTGGGGLRLNRSKDNGRTWLNPALEEVSLVAPLSDPTLRPYQAGARMIPTAIPSLGVPAGRIYHALGREFDVLNNPVLSRYGFVHWSDDNGLTWSTPVQLPSLDFDSVPSTPAQLASPKFAAVAPCSSSQSAFIATHAALMTTSDGPMFTPPTAAHPNRLLLPVYFGDTRFAATYHCAVLYSDDAGLTWGYQANLVPSWVDQSGVTSTNLLGLNFQEPQFQYLDDGSILCLIRTDNFTGFNIPQSSNIWRTSSTDNGATWSPARLAFVGSGWPSHVQFPNPRTSVAGAIVTAARQWNVTQTLRKSAIRVSLDRGFSWSPEFTIFDPVFGAGSNAYSETVLSGNMNEVGIATSNEWPQTANGAGPTKVEYILVNVGTMLDVETLAGAGSATGSVLWSHWSIDTVLAADPNASGADTVASLADMSGNSRTLSAVTSNPLLRFGTTYTTGFKGLPVLDMHTAAALSGPATSLSQPFTIIMALACNSDAGSLFLWDDGSLTGFMRWNGSGARTFGLRATGAGADMIFNAPSSWPAGPAILTMVMNGTSSSVRVNGVACTVSSGTTPGAAALPQFRLAHSGTDGWAQEFREIVMLSSADPGIIGNIEALLIAKHRING